MHLCAELPLPSDLSPVGVLTEVRNRRLPKVYTPTQTTETAQPRWPVVAWKALTKPKAAKRQTRTDLEKEKKNGTAKHKGGRWGGGGPKWTRARRWLERASRTSAPLLLTGHGRRKHALGGRGSLPTNWKVHPSGNSMPFACLLRV